MKKIVSLVLILSLMCSMVSMFSIVSFSAAKDDAWTCGDCVRYAKARFREIWGFDLHPAYSDSADGYYYKASSSGDTISSTPKTGALAIWEGHVAIVESVSGSYVTYSEGGYDGHFNQETCHTSSMSKDNQPFLGYVYVKGTYDATSKPTNVKLKVNKNSFVIGEKIQFSATSNYGYGYTIGINKYNENTEKYERIYTNDINVNFEYVINSEGKYCAYVSAWNDIGLSDSEKVYFSVGIKPVNAKLTTNKKSFNAGEKIQFSATSDYALGYAIGIGKYNENTQKYERIYTGDIGNNFEYIINNIGEYCAYVSAWNDVGLDDSEKVYFSVGIAPQYAELKISKNTFDIGEKILFSATSDYALGYAIGIGKYNDNTQKYERICTENIVDSYEYTINVVGKYCAYVTAWNNSGYIDSEKVYFTVHDPDETFNVTYNANGGSGAPSTDTKKYNKFLYLSPTEPTRDGYNFLGWSTDKNATEPDYLPGDTYSENKDVTLYAVWKEVINEFTFTGEIETFGSSEDEITFEFIKAGETEACYSTTLDGDALTYEFFGIENGEYTMRVSKNNHVAREYEVVVGTEDINVDVELNLIGDVNSDGKITLIDYTQVLRHVKKTSALDGYTFECADVNGDGKITITDYTRILKHVKKTENLW